MGAIPDVRANTIFAQPQLSGLRFFQDQLGPSRSRINTIANPLPISFADVALLPNNQIGLTLGGGRPGIDYNVLRSTDLKAALADGSWSLVGSMETGETWVDTAPSLPTAFYGASEPEP